MKIREILVVQKEILIEQKDKHPRIFKIFSAFLWGILVVFLVFVASIVVPIIISELYKCPAKFPWLQVNWCASDALSFYSGLLSVSVALLGVWMTIRGLQRGRINEVKPYLMVQRLEYTAESNSQTKPNDDNMMNAKYNEYKADSFCFEIVDGNVLSSGNIKSERISSISSGDSFIRPFKITNVGKGAAVDLLIGFNSALSPDEKMMFIRTTAQVGEDIFARIILVDKNSKLNAGKYYFTILYSDIYGNKYYQNEEYTIEKNNAMSSPVDWKRPFMEQHLVGGRFTKWTVSLWKPRT